MGTRNPCHWLLLAPGTGRPGAACAPRRACVQSAEDAGRAKPRRSQVGAAHGQRLQEAPGLGSGLNGSPAHTAGAAAPAPARGWETGGGGASPASPRRRPKRSSCSPCGGAPACSGRVCCPRWCRHTSAVLSGVCVGGRPCWCLNATGKQMANFELLDQSCVCLCLLNSQTVNYGG